MYNRHPSPWLLPWLIVAAPALAQPRPARVTVANTPLPVEARVTAPVSIAGTASVRDVDATARNGFNAWVQCVAPAGNPVCKASIPLGPNQMAVVETLTASVFTSQAVSGPAVAPSGQLWAQSPVVLGSTPAVVNLPFSMDRRIGGGYEYASAPMALRLYAARTTAIELQGYRPDAFNAQEATFRFNVTGYVLPCGPARTGYDCPAPD